MNDTPKPPPNKEPWDSKPWTLTFEAAGIGPPVECRIRRLLKAAGRAYGLRCISYGPDPVVKVEGGK